MFSNVYYQVDSQEIFLKLDGVLRLIPDKTTFQYLFGAEFSPTLVNQFANRTVAPLAIGYPMLTGAKVYMRQGNTQTGYLADIFPWDTGKTVFRKIINKTQLAKLGFSSTFNVWPTAAVPGDAVPLAVDSNWNWHVWTFYSGYYIVYNKLCHPENPINPWFKTWLDHGYSPADVKRLIIDTQAQLDDTNGVKASLPPTFAPVAGSYPNPTLNVTMTCATTNATMYYTTDGTDPLPGISTVYSGPVALPISKNTCTLKAVSEYHDSLGVSPVTTAQYTHKSFPVELPQMNPAEGNLTTPTANIQLSCATPNTRICYTLDDTAPNANSATYTTAIPLDLTTSSKTIKAIAVHNEYRSESGVASATYRFVPEKLSPPLFSPKDTSRVGPGVTISLKPADPSSVILYGIGATAAVSQSYQFPVRTYFTSANGYSVTVRAMAMGTQFQDSSDIVSNTYSGSVQWLHAWDLADDVNDSVGTVNLNNTSVTFSTGSVGDSATFNGTALLSTESTSDMQSPVFTVSAWAKIDSIVNADNYSPVWVLERLQDSYDGPGVFVFADGMVQAETLQSNKQFALFKTASGAVKLGQWVHYVLTAANKTLTLYLNGQVAGSTLYDGTVATDCCGRFCIGADRGANSQGGTVRHGMTGSVDRVYYTNVGLTAQQVLSLYNSEKTPNL